MCYKLKKVVLEKLVPFVHNLSDFLTFVLLAPVCTGHSL